jgi:membrane fusion protein, multidrug efflux system
VIFTLPQDDIPKFIHKLRTGADLPVNAFNRNSTQQLATGRLATIDNQIDTSTGTVKLRATFANDDETLFPNQFVNVKLVVDTLHGASTVPIAAVQIGAHGSYVYVANADETVSVRNVTLGATDGQRREVKEGLVPGEKVVIDGIDRLRDGAKYKLPDANAPGKAQGGPRDGQPKRKDGKK